MAHPSHCQPDRIEDLNEKHPKEKPTIKKTWIRVQKPSFWTFRIQIHMPRINPVRQSLVEHLKEIPPGSKKAQKGGRFSIKKGWCWWPIRGGAWGPLSVVFLKNILLSCCSCLQKVCSNPPTRLLTYVCSLILFSEFQSHLWFSFEVQPGLILFRFLFHPYFIFITPTGGPLPTAVWICTRQFILHPQFSISRVV